MRAVAIAAAAVIGGFFGMFLGTALTMGAGQNVGMVGSVAGLLVGAVGLGWLVARLVPARPSRLRDRGAERMQRR